MKTKNNIIAFIPAREGSKIILKKNLKKIKKKSLVEITLSNAIKSNLFKTIVLSSDDSKILKLGKKIKKVITFKRPKSISRDTSTTDEAILHYLDNYQYDEEYLIILQVTSPLRKLKTLIKFANYCTNNKIKNCLSVTLKKDHVSKFGKYFKPIEKNNIRRRQNRKGFLVENGMFYFLNIKDFLRRRKIYTKNWNYFTTDEYESIDINNYRDLQIARIIYNKL